MIYYTCPVCAYDKMTEPPEFWNTCPCCGTEFENHTYYKTPAQLREDWISNGKKWYSRVRPQPEDWNPYEQLGKAGYLSDLVRTSGAATTPTQKRIEIVSFGISVAPVAI